MALFNNMTSRVTPEVFFSKLFEIRDTVHLLHLKTKSYAQHMALNSLYESVLDLADGIVESYQGIHGIVEFEIKSFKTNDAISYVSESYEWIQSNRGIFTESWIQNEIDNVCKELAQTKYKLENLA